MAPAWFHLSDTRAQLSTTVVDVLHPAAFQSSRFTFSTDESTQRLHLGSDDPCICIRPSESVGKIHDSASALFDSFVTRAHDPGRLSFFSNSIRQHGCSLDSFCAVLAATVSERSNGGWNRRVSCELTSTAPCDRNSPRL